MGPLYPWFGPWVLKPRWIPHLLPLSPACNGFLRFTSGATPASSSVRRMLVTGVIYHCSFVVQIPSHVESISRKENAATDTIMLFLFLRFSRRSRNFMKNGSNFSRVLFEQRGYHVQRCITDARKGSIRVTMRARNMKSTRLPVTAILYEICLEEKGDAMAHMSFWICH